METIKITTPQNVDVEFGLASLGDRILGRILDNVILGAYIALLIVFANLSFDMSYLWWLAIIVVLPIVLYDLLCEILLNGQSAGKKIMGIRVISLSGGQPTLGQYLNRWLFRSVDFLLSGSVLALIMVAATEKKQRLGDLVAGTIVIKIKPKTAFSQTLYEPAASDYQVTYPAVINLGDRDIELIKEILANVRQSGNTMLALQAQQKVEQTLHIMSRHSDPEVFLRVVLADYNHLTSAQ